GLAENLTPLINSDPEVDPNDLLELALNFFRLRQDPNEDVYGLSVGWTTNLLFYNKTLFQEMGVEDPAVQYANGRWDKSAFFETARALTSDSDGDGINDTFGYELGTWFANMDFFIGANGLDSIYDPDTNRLLYDDPRIQEAYEFVHDSMYEWKIMPAPSDEHASFNLGKVGMFIAGNWTIGRLKALEADWEWGVTMPPKWDRYYTNFRSNGMALSTRTDYQAQAWDVLKEFTLGYGTVLRAKYEFSFPATQSGFDLQTGVDPIWVESLQYASVPAQHLRWAEIRQIVQKYHAAYWQDPDADYSEMATSILRDSDEIFAED
ncbi:MAG: extracellular solute-binding protein, partial [Spirochaetaceae bacterium]|nr:extracellular solute-binding protein [Spirochaetaceae bacterium]